MSECLILISMIVGILFLVLIQSKCTSGGGALALFMRFREKQIPVEVDYMGTARDVLKELERVDSRLALPPNQLFHFDEKLPLELDVPMIDLNVTYEDTLNLQRYVSWTPSSNEKLHEAVKNYNAGTSPDIRHIPVSNITIMSGLFAEDTHFNEDISLWDTSSVKCIRDVFLNAEAFNQDISGWNTSRVVYMDGTFKGAASFNQDIGRWNTLKAFDMYGMFRGTNSFNQDLTGWLHPQFFNNAYMFSNAAAIDPTYIF